MDATSRYDELVISNSSFTQRVYRFEPGTRVYVRNYDDMVHKLSGGPTRTTIKAGGQPVSVDLAALCCDKSSKYDLSLVDVQGDVMSICTVIFATTSAGGLEYEIKKREQLSLNKKQYAEKAVGVERRHWKKESTSSSDSLDGNEAAENVFFPDNGQGSYSVHASRTKAAPHRQPLTENSTKESVQDDASSESSFDSEDDDNSAFSRPPLAASAGKLGRRWRRSKGNGRGL